jgi:hypothetical protein
MAEGTAMGSDPFGTAPTLDPPGKQTAWVRGKQPGASYAKADRNPTHWTTDANNWFCWGGSLTEANGKYFVKLGNGTEDFTINPEGGNGYTAFSVASVNDVLCLEYDKVAAGTPKSGKYSVAEQGSSGKYTVTETDPHTDGDGKFDHFYVFVTVGTDICLCDPMIRND